MKGLEVAGCGIKFLCNPFQGLKWKTRNENEVFQHFL